MKEALRRSSVCEGSVPGSASVAQGSCKGRVAQGLCCTRIVLHKGCVAQGSCDGIGAGERRPTEEVPQHSLLRLCEMDWSGNLIWVHHCPKSAAAEASIWRPKARLVMSAAHRVLSMDSAVPQSRSSGLHADPCTSSTAQWLAAGVAGAARSGD